MKHKMSLEASNPDSPESLELTAGCVIDDLMGEIALEGGSAKGRWVVTVEFTPEADLELERQCTCAKYRSDMFWESYTPCADGKPHDTRRPVAAAAMKEAKWPCGKLKYPELSK